MRPKPIAVAATLVLTAGGLSTATMGGAAPGPAVCDPASSSCVLVPPSEGQAYHAAFPGFGGPEDRVEPRRLRSFEAAAGRQVAWAYFSNNWLGGEIRFPKAGVETIDSEGRVPFIRLMARSGFGAGRDPSFSMRSIAEGEWDAEIERWCRDAAATGIPLLAEFGAEVNGSWFAWNGRWNGAGNTGWGDTELADGPETFRAAYRHLVETCRAEGADDITWFFHADAGGRPRAGWNDAWLYYPGDDIIDWVGLSGYGPLEVAKPGAGWESFHSRIDGFFGELKDHLGDDKPFAVLEYGAAAAPRASQQRRKARWIVRAARLTGSEHWPDIRALAYWHERFRNGDGSVSDLEIDSSPAVRAAYRDALAGEEFSSLAEFDER